MPERENDKQDKKAGEVVTIYPRPERRVARGSTPPGEINLQEFQKAKERLAELRRENNNEDPVISFLRDEQQLVRERINRLQEEERALETDTGVISEKGGTDLQELRKQQAEALEEEKRLLQAERDFIDYLDQPASYKQEGAGIVITKRLQDYEKAHDPYALEIKKIDHDLEQSYSGVHDILSPLEHDSAYAGWFEWARRYEGAIKERQALKDEIERSEDFERLGLLIELEKEIDALKAKDKKQKQAAAPFIKELVHQAEENMRKRDELVRARNKALEQLQTAKEALDLYIRIAKLSIHRS